MALYDAMPRHWREFAQEYGLRIAKLAMDSGYTPSMAARQVEGERRAEMRKHVES